MASDDNTYDERISDAIRSLADESGQLTSPPPNLWGRIERALDDDGPERQDLVSPPAALWDRIADEIRSDDDRSARRPTRSRRRALVAVAIAASVAIVVAIAAWPRPDTATEVVARATLSGEGLDPGGTSTGSADLTTSDGRWSVTVSASDLPAPPPGTYYEAWLLSAGADQIQSLGTLDGDATFAVPDGISIRSFPVVDVSIEPLDGDPTHSSKSVLRGNLETI